MSLFSSTTMSFLAARKPALEPPPKPRFAGSARTCTAGKLARRKSALPSVEPLSTTRISLPGLPARAVQIRRMYFSRRSRPFQLGITTVAAELAARRGGGKAGAERRRKTWAQTRPRKLIATRNGESRSRGSARRRRFSRAMSERGAEAYLAAQLDPPRGAHQVELLFQLAFLLLQAERPGGAFLQVLFGLLQGSGGLGQLFGNLCGFRR